MSIEEMLEAVTLLIEQIESALKPHHPKDHKFSHDLDEPGLCAICGWYSLSDKDLREAGTTALEQLMIMQATLKYGTTEEVAEIQSQLKVLFQEEKDVYFNPGFQISLN
jgi:hypothetical protein